MTLPLSVKLARPLAALLAPTLAAMTECAEAKTDSILKVECKDGEWTVYYWSGGTFVESSEGKGPTLSEALLAFEADVG